MKKMLIMLAVATLPATAGCNLCGLGTCPCNPCNWGNRGAYCGPTAYATPVVAPTCPPTYTPAVMQQAVPQQYVMPTQAPYATPYTAAPMMAAPQQQMPYDYSEPGCGYVAEPSCGYMGTVGYGPSMMPMEMGGMGSCCETGAYDAGAVGAPGETYIDPAPQAE